MASFILLFSAVHFYHVFFLLPPRLACGPFGSGETVFNVTGTCVASLPSPAQTTLRYLASEAFALPLILAEM